MPEDHSVCDALVLGVDEHTGLEAARNLREKGVRVLGGGLDPKGYGFRSRALTARFVYPNPETNREGFVRSVKEAALRHRVRAILPSLDTALLALHKERGAFDGVAPLGIASRESLDKIIDKGRLQDLAVSVGVEMPRSLALEDGQQLPADFPLPAIVKQRDQGHHGPRKVIYCRTRDELLAAVRVYLDSGSVPIVQELVYGYGVQIVGLCRDGELVQRFQYRRLHEYSCRGGLGSLAVSEPLNPALLERSERLIRALQWDGIVGVEFKLPPDPSHSPSLIEINARFVGFMGLAMDAGLNFPHMQYRLTVGEDPGGPPLPYRVGVRYQRWLLDTLSVIELLLERPAVSGVPLPGRARRVWDYLTTYGPGVRSDWFRLSDPKPGALLVARGLPVVARRLLRALRSRARTLHASAALLRLLAS
jgi:predicted ATP-grasp superfamily ATP-dependent carboligase